LRLTRGTTAAVGFAALLGITGTALGLAGAGPLDPAAAPPTSAASAAPVLARTATPRSTAASTSTTAMVTTTTTLARPAPVAAEATPAPAVPAPVQEAPVPAAPAEEPAPPVEEPVPVLAPAAEPAPALVAFAPASQSPAEDEFVNLTNSARAAVGLASLQTDAGLHDYAVNQALAMAAAGQIYHSDISVLLGAWYTVGENVGVGPAVGPIQAALLASPGHYANIVHGAYTVMGVGVVVDAAGRVWTAHVFAA
jgi:uncharacterized protein YkwD